MNHIKNIRSTILLIVIVFCLIVLNCCQRPEKQYRYEIHGYVIKDGRPHRAIWYTDTIEIGENYLRYENTDGSEVIIPSPFVLIDHQHDKVTQDSVSPFR